MHFNTEDAAASKEILMNLIEEEAGDKRVATGIFYRKFANFTGSSFAPVEDWVNGPWYTIAKLKVTDSESGIGSFSIFNDNEFNFSYDADGNNEILGDENYSEMKQELNRKYDSITLSFHKFSIDFIRKNSSSLAILFALYNQYGQRLPVFQWISNGSATRN